MSNIKKCLRILCKNYSTCDKNPCECDKFNGLVHVMHVWTNQEEGCVKVKEVGGKIYVSMFAV